MKTVGSVVLALVVPIAWGLLSSWVFDRLRLKRRGEEPFDIAPEE